MKLFLRSILFCAIASFTSLAYADPDWTNEGPNSNFDNPLNWLNAANNPAVPGPADSAHVFPGFIVSTGLIVTPGSLTTITINAPGNESVQSFLVSSNFVGSTVPNGILNLSIASGSTFNVGPGDFVVTGTSTVNFTGNLTMPTGNLVVGTSVSTIDSGEVTGSGTLNLSSGTVNLDGTGSFIVGQSASASTGTVVQSGTSIVIAGANLDIGTSGAAGTYTVMNNAALDIGMTGGAGAVSAYTVTLGGAATAASSTLNIQGNGTLDATNAGTLFQIAEGTGSVAVVNQSGNSTVTIGGNILSIGDGGNGTYNFNGGTLTVSSGQINIASSGGSGLLSQTGGALIVGPGTGVFIGFGGTGTYALSGGTADFQDGLDLGAVSSGVVMQTSGTLTVENSSVLIDSFGTYNLEGGTATLNAGLTYNTGGSFNQTGGTLVIPAGQTIDLSTAGTSYTLGGGILQIDNNGLVGTAGEGNLNFAGGTLQITSAGGFTDPLGGTVSGTSTLDTTNSDITLSGALTDAGTGHGTLDVIGGGNVNLITSNNNAASWGLNIINGTVNATASLFPSSGAITIGSGGAGATGTFNLAVAGGVNKLTGDVTSTGVAGTGAFNINFATAGDTLELAGPTNNYGGQTTLSGGGTLQVFTGTFGNIGGNGAVAIGGDAAVAPTGTVILAGTNSYSGVTTVNDGFTLLTNNLAGNVSVQNLGTFGSGLTPGTLPSTQATTVALGGGFNSTGSILLNANGTVTDLYTVTGSSTLSGKVVLAGVGTITDHVFIDSPAGLNTAGLTLSVAGSGALFNATIQQVGNTEEISTVQNPTSLFAQTPNQLAVAGAIDPILTSASLSPNFVPLGIALNNLTASQVSAALDQLSPESLQYARNIAFENSTFLVERMNSVDADLRGGYGGLDTNAISVVAPGMGSSLGRSLGNLFAYNSPSFHPPAPNGVNYYPGEDGGSSSPSSSSPSSPASTPAFDSSTQVISDTPNPYLAAQNPSSPETPGFSQFIGGDVILADLNQNQSGANAPSSKASYTAGDATAGVSFRMNSHLSAGVLFDYNHTDAKTDSSGSKTKVDSYSPGLFATYFDHGFYANGLFSFGYNKYTNTRNIDLLGETASSNPSGQQYVGDLDFGYDFHPAKNWVVGPTLGVTYTHLDIASFTETGAPGANLDVDSQSADSLRSRLGGYVVFQTNTGDVLLQPNLTAMWQHEYLDSSSGITSSFNDFSSSPFTINTAAPDRDSALIGVGLTATLSNSMALYFNYLADVDVSGGNYWAQSVVGGFKARF